MYVVSNLINFKHINIKIINIHNIEIVEYFIRNYIKYFRIYM